MLTFDSLFSTNISFGVRETLICLGAALVFGLIMSVAYMFGGNYTKSFAVSLVLFPAVVQAVILFVNQSFGAALAVGGTFALLRFRSAPGSAREITALFSAVAVGIAAGMGYVLYGAILTVVFSAVIVVLGVTPFGEDRGHDRIVHILIPESLNYTGLFDEVFSAYTRKVQLELVKTTNMGSLYEARYRVTLKDTRKEKEMLDALRERNGNLPISCSAVMTEKVEL